MSRSTVGWLIDTVHPTEANRFLWSYSGLHLLQIDGIETESPQLHVQGVIKTAQSNGPAAIPPYFVPDRSVLHGDSVFAIQGDTIFSNLWSNIDVN